mgnify:FL=1
MVKGLRAIGFYIRNISKFNYGDVLIATINSVTLASLCSLNFKELFLHFVIFCTLPICLNFLSVPDEDD